MIKTLQRWFDSDVGYSFRTSPVAITAAVVAFLCVFCAAFAGWVAAWSNARPAAWILMAVPLSYSLTFLLIEACIRYTYPIAWSLLLAAGALTASRLGTGEGRYLVR